MPSSALTVHFQKLLDDAGELDSAHSVLTSGRPGRQYKVASLNRAIIIACTSAWESFVEELVREAVSALRPPIPFHPGAWPALKAHSDAELKRFHTPNSTNVKRLLAECLSLPDVTIQWRWQNQTSADAKSRLDAALTERHKIAHGVNPRPTILNHYAGGLIPFFNKLAARTDAAVRDHLVTVCGLPNPWPA